MKKKITVLTLCAMLFAICAISEAQQPDSRLTSEASYMAPGGYHDGTFTR